MTDTAKLLAKNLRNARVASGLSQQEVAKRLGVPRTAITNIENGNRKVSSLELTRLAAFYEKLITDFFEVME
jgi:transcriptional regulator with XRE-family HTH domain